VDVMNTFILFLRFQVMRGLMMQDRYDAECALLREFLAQRPEPHWQEFLALWKN
jgi:3'-5' exonuclease